METTGLDIRTPWVGMRRACCLPCASVAVDRVLDTHIRFTLGCESLEGTYEPK